MSDSQKTILIIEDDNALRNVLRDKLSVHGFNIIEAANGEDGLAVALKEHPELILLDILMPRMDGISMLAQMRGSNDPWAKHVPVMVLTNSTDAQTIYRATSLGANDFLMKSDISLDVVIQKIRERIGSSSGALEQK